jgi:hypothetical protein
MDEHRYLVDYESTPKRVRIQVAGVRQEDFGSNIFQASRAEMPAKIATNEVIIDRFPEDAVESIQFCRLI